MEWNSFNFPFSLSSLFDGAISSAKKKKSIIEIERISRRLITFNKDPAALQMQRSGSDSAIIRELGTFIKETRLKKNYTQGDLAEKAGVHRVTLSEFEHGLRG